MRLLVVRDVSAVFGGIIASNCVSFDMHKGAILGLIGQNGAGKTTLFNCLSRLHQPSSDDILMDGLSILTRPPHRIAEIGIVRTFQNVALFPNLSVVDNVHVGCHSRSSSDIISDSIKLAWVRRGEAAGIIRFGFGFLFGKPALRLSDVNLALATFAVRGTRRLHHHARDLAVSRHGGRRRRLAAWIDRRCRLHHLRAEYRREHLQGSLGCGVRRAAVSRHLSRAARRQAGCRRFRQIV
jgi:ABC-type sugar transport system ATPase subunit